MARCDLTEEPTTKLTQLDDELYRVLSAYYIHLAAIQAITAYGWPESSDKLNLGLSVTSDWLVNQGDHIIGKLEELREWMEAAKEKI